MAYDDLIVGSGLAALGVALGLSPRRRLLVLAGDKNGAFRYYGGKIATPCSHTGLGGLGQYWHGVIPSPDVAPWPSAISQPTATANDFAKLFAHFYPGVDMPANSLFVPWRAIRPMREWGRLLETHKDLHWCSEIVTEITICNPYSASNAIEVRTERGLYRARRIWLAAGSLRTPSLIQPAVKTIVAREFASDHVMVYLGQVERKDLPDNFHPRVYRNAHGFWIPASLAVNQRALLFVRPARFDFAKLDAGIAQRAAYGLPATSAARKIASGASLGMISEALYTRLGLFPTAKRFSIYAQLPVSDAYRFNPEARAMLQEQSGVIDAAITMVRSGLRCASIEPSRQPSVFLPGIHLHNTVETELLQDMGLLTGGSSVHIADASAVRSVGPAHHSFRTMLSGFVRAHTFADST